MQSFPSENEVQKIISTLVIEFFSNITFGLLVIFIAPGHVRVVYGVVVQ